MCGPDVAEHGIEACSALRPGGLEMVGGQGVRLFAVEPHERPQLVLQRLEDQPCIQLGIIGHGLPEGGRPDSA